MHDTFWQAKICAPQQRWIVQRDRLHRLLDETADVIVTWVSAPAGSGKTTLATSYAREFNGPSLWYQLDPGDEDLTSFFNVLRQAAARTGPTRSMDLPDFTTAVMPAAAPFARRFFEQLGHCLVSPSLIVFDDYQELPEAAALHGILPAAIEALPGGTRVLVLSRMDPPPSFARLRATGQLTRLPWESLRLTSEETGEIVALRLHGGGENLARRLNERCGGWAAGLVLMCEQARQGSTSFDAVDSLAEGLVFDYFAGEILDHVNAQDHRFLLTSSLLPYLTPTLAGRLSPSGCGVSVLRRLQRRNYFIFKHSDQEDVYRYHPLFRDFLRKRMAQALSASELTDLRGEIATLLLEAKEPDDAIRLLVDAGDWERVEPILLAAAPNYAYHDRIMSLRNWIQSFPRGRLDRSPWLLYWLAVSWLSADQGQAGELFERAYEQFEIDGDRSGGLLACAGVIDAEQLAFADCRRIDPWLHRLRLAFGDTSEKLDPDVEARAAYALFVGALSGTEERPELAEWAGRAHRIALSGNDINLRMQTAYAAISYHLWMGEPERARLILDEMQSWSRRRSATPLMVLTTLTAQAMYQWLSGQFDESLDSVNAGMALAEETDVWVWSSMLGGHGLAAALSKGDLPLAHQFLSAVGAGRERARPLDLAYFHFLASWRALIENRPEEAAAHDARAHEIGADALPLVAQGVLHFNRIQVTLALGRPLDAAAPLRRLEDTARRTNSHLLRFMAGTGQALSELELGDGSCDLAALAHTLGLARTQGLVNFFGWCAPAMTRIAEVALKEEIETNYVARLVRSRKLLPQPSPITLETWPWSLRVRSLGGFSLVRDGKPLNHNGKAQRKPLELLHALLAYGGHAVSAERLSVEIWPDAHGAAARRAFDTNLHRLRRLLGIDGILRLEEGKLSLADHLAWIDIHALEALVDDALEWIRSHADGMEAESLHERILRVGDLYRGPFLAGICDELWALARRERLQQLMLRLLREAGRHFEGAAAWREAADCYTKARDIEPLAEEFHQLLMQTLHRQGFKAEALAAYERCRDEMSSALGVKPSPQTLAIHRRILSESSD